MAATQYPLFPWEITDIIIDHLHSDLRSLGICSTVCSEWLIRSRFHMFSTVQLWPWRARRFFDLAKSENCTFTHHIHRIELDDSRARERTQGVRRTLQGNEDETVPFNEAMDQSDILCFSHVKSMQVNNVDWTTLSPIQQRKLRERLANFSKLKRLELQGVTFHDIRELIRVVSSFPSLQQLSAHVFFLKYLNLAIHSALTQHLPPNVQTIELGTDDGIQVILSSLAGTGEPHVSALKLQNINCCHLQYILAALRRSESNLQHVSLGFSRDTLQFTREDDFLNAVDLSCLSQLQTLSIEGLRIQEKKNLSVLELTLVRILQRIESPFLESIDLGFLLDANAVLGVHFGWRSLEQVLLVHHFFGLKLVRVVIVLSEEATIYKRESVEQWIRREMSDLDRREILAVQVI